MKKYAWCLLAVVAGAFAVQAYAQTTTASADTPAATNTTPVATTGAANSTKASAASPANAEKDPNRRVCWHETPVGTHFQKTVCKTVGEMQREKEQTDRMVNKAFHQQRQSNLGPGASSGI